MFTFLSRCLILGMGLAITTSAVNAQVQLKPLQQEYQSADAGVVALPLVFANTSNQNETIAGTWQWIDHQQQLIEQGSLPAIAIKALDTMTQTLQLPVSSSTHYKLQVNWQAGEQSQQDVLDMITDAPQAQRPTLLLSGTWEQATSDGFWPFEKARRDQIPQIPDDLSWKQTTLPANVGATQDKQGVIHWYRKTLSLPNWLVGDKQELVFDGIGKRAHVWINGQHIAYLEGAWTTYVLDITTALKLHDENTILIAAADHTAQKQDPTRGNKFNWPIGHSGNAFAGVYDHLWLRAHSSVYTRSWQWRYDHDRKQLEIKAMVVNGTSKALPAGCQFEIRLNDENGPVFQAQTPVAIPAGSEQLVIQTLDLAKARLWWPAMTDAPGRPFLYGLKLNVRVNDQLLDQMHDRIGLRSIDVQHGLYVINGVPIHPVARGMGGWTGARSWANARQATEPGYGDYSRIHCNPLTRNVVEAAEENGHLIQLETPLTASGYGYPLDDSDFWDNFRTQNRQIIETYRNNAAVVSMSLSNEVFLCGAEKYPKALDQMAGEWRYATQHTPGWPVVVNGDGDLRGRIATANLHYPRHLSRHPLLPMDAYWLEHDKLQKLDLYPGSFTWRKDQLLEIGEDQWNGFSAWPHGCAIMQGDSVYADDKAALAGHDAAAIQYMLGYRDADVAYQQPWAKTSSQARAYANQPIAAYLVDQYQTTMPGRNISWQVNVFNDSLAQHTFKITAKSSLFDVTVVEPVILSPSHKQRVTLKIPISDKLKNQDVTWQLTLTDEQGKQRFSDEHLLRIRNDTQLKQPQSTLLVMRGNGQLVARLDKLHLQYKLLDHWDALDDQAGGMLLVGSDATLSAMNGVNRKSLADFAQRGGHVMFFSQRQYPSWSVIPARMNQDTGHDATLAHVLATNHPMLAGLNSEDFKYWPNGHRVSGQDFYKPESDGAIALLATGGRIGLAWSPLMFVPSGKGWFLLSQLDLLEQWDNHPAPSRLLSNVLKMADDTANKPARRLFVLGEAPGLLQAMQRIGLSYESISDPAQLSHLSDNWLLIPQGQWASSWTQPVMQFIEQGGHVWLMDWDSDGFKQLDAQCHISPLRRDLKQYSLDVRKEMPYMQTLSSFDCFWAQPTQGDPTPLTNISRIALADYDAQGKRIDLDQMQLDTAGTKDTLTTWGLPDGFKRIYNFKSQKQRLQWTVPKDLAGTWYVGLTGRVAHQIPREVEQLSVAYVTLPFSWSLARQYQLQVNDKPLPLQNTGDAVQIPVRAKGWAMPYGCMVSEQPITLNAGDVITIQTSHAGSTWVAGLDLFRPRSSSQLTPLTNPGTLSLLQMGQGRVLLDGINWDGGLDKANHMAAMMLNDQMAGMGLSFKPFESRMQSTQTICQLLPDEATLRQESGKPTLHIDGTRNMHTPFRNAVALRVPGQWATWQVPDTLHAGSYQLRVVARVSNTSPRNTDLSNCYVLEHNGKTMPLVLDRTLGEPFVAFQANGWAVVYGTLRCDTPLTLQPGDHFSLGINRSATAFVAMVQLVNAVDAIPTHRLNITGGVSLKLNRTITVNWSAINQKLALQTSTGLSPEHRTLQIDGGGKPFKRLRLMQSFYHPWTDFAGQSADKPVAHATVHYVDGSIAEFDVIYYQHVTMPLDAQATLPQAKLLWQDKQPFADFLDELTGKSGRWIQMQHPTPIYGMAWDNPHPDKPVKSLEMRLVQDGVLIVFAVQSES